MGIQRQKGTVIEGVPGENYDVVDFPEAASQSFKRGQWVVLSSGKATVVASDATELAGLALEDASGVTDAPVQIAVPRASCKFRSSVFHGTPGSAITAITQPGSKFGLEVENNKCYIGIDDTSNKAFLATRVVLPTGHAVGDQWGILEFEVLGGGVNQLSNGDET